MHGNSLSYLIGALVAALVAWLGSMLLPGLLGTIALYVGGAVALILIILFLFAILGGGVGGPGRRW